MLNNYKNYLNTIIFTVSGKIAKLHWKPIQADVTDVVPSPIIVRPKDSLISPTR